MTSSPPHRSDPLRSTATEATRVAGAVTDSEERARGEWVDHDGYDDWLEAQVQASADALGAGDVELAAKRLWGNVVTTPVLRNPHLDALAGAELWLKAENMQFGGAFKARGAMNCLLRMTPEQRRRGIVTYSSGNHGRAVAWAAHRFGVPACVVMPKDAPEIKRRAIDKLGGEVVLAGTTSDERRAVARAIRSDRGCVIVPPFDHVDVICGQGTAALELLRAVAEDRANEAALDVGSGERQGQSVGQGQKQSVGRGRGLDALFVPVGGGGLIAGACLACRGLDVEIHAVEPIGCDALAQSLEAGHRVAVEPESTLADGLKPLRPGALTYAIAKNDVRACHRVDDDAIARGLVGLLQVAKTWVEPSGAAAFAAAFAYAQDHARAGLRPRIGVILSGGNVDPRVVCDLLHRHSESRS